MKRSKLRRCSIWCILPMEPLSPSSPSGLNHTPASFFSSPGTSPPRAQPKDFRESPLPPPHRNLRRGRPIFSIISFPIPLSARIPVTIGSLTGCLVKHSSFAACPLEINLLSNLLYSLREIAFTSCINQPPLTMMRRLTGKHTVLRFDKRVQRETV